MTKMRFSAFDRMMPRDHDPRIMNCIRARRRWRPMVWAALVLSGVFIAAETPEIVSPKLESSLEVIMPVALRSLTFAQPSARFLARVGADGKVMDSVCIAAPHYGMVDRAREALLDARFVPGLRNGAPAMLDIEIDVQFFLPNANQTAQQSTLDHLESMHHQMNPDAFKYALVKADDLDSPLSLVDRGSQFVPEDDDGNRLGGSALIECIVDHHGVPRMFRIIRTDGEEVAEAALLSMRSMRFAEPRRNGSSVAVKVRIPMTFEAPPGG